MLISGVPAGTTLRWPSVSVHGEGAYIAANLFPIDPAAPLLPRPVATIRLPDGPIAPPPGPFQFAYPKGVLDSLGSFHLFWAEFAEPQPLPSTWSGRPLVSLWHSALDGGTWSAPELVLGGTRIDWGAESGAVAVDAGNRVHLVVPVTGPTGRTVMSYLRSAGNRWERTSFPVPAAYASITDAGGDSLLIAYVAPDTTMASDANSLFALVSDDGGSRWNAPRLLSRSGARAALAPFAVRSGDGALHVVWAQNQSGGLAAEVLRHRRSVDGGATWEELADAPLRGELLRYSVADEGCGGITAVVESFDGTRLLLHEVRWTGTRLTSAQLFPELHMAANAGLTLRGDSLRLVWSAVRRADDDALPMTAVRGTCPGETPGRR